MDENGNYIKEIIEKYSEVNVIVLDKYVEFNVIGGLLNILCYKWFDLNFMFFY